MKPETCVCIIGVVLLILVFSVIEKSVSQECYDKYPNFNADELVKVCK